MAEQMPLTRMTDDQFHETSVHLANLLFQLKNKRKAFADVKKDFTEEIKALEMDIAETARVIREQEALRNE